MKKILFTILLMFVPVGQVMAYSCIDKNPEEVLEKAAVIGVFEIQEIIEHPLAHLKNESGEVMVPPGEEGVSHLVLSPLVEYKGKFSEKNKVSLSALECRINDLKTGQIREMLIFKNQADQLYIPESTNKLDNETWEKFRAENHTDSIVNSKKEACLKNNKRWIFPLGGIAQCAE